VPPESGDQEMVLATRDALCPMRQTVHSSTLPVGGRSGNGTLVSRCHSRSAEAPAGRLQNSLRMTEPLAPFLEVRPEGLYCPAFDAAIDPPVPARRAIVSPPHGAAAAPRGQEGGGTPDTIPVYRRRNPDWTGEAREMSYGERFERHGVTVELYPAGHVLGSAQIYFEREGRSLLYPGDFKRRPSRTAVPAAAPPAGILATETTFGLPVFRFPKPKGLEDRLARAAILGTEATFGLPVFRFPKPKVLEDRLVAACHAAFDEEKTPVVLVYAFGKAQEVALALTDAGVPTVLHGAAWKLLPEVKAA